MNRKIILFCVVSLIAIGVLLAGRAEEPGKDDQADGVVRDAEIPAAVTGDAVITSVSGAALGDAGEEGMPDTENESETDEVKKDGEVDDSEADKETDPPVSNMEAGRSGNSKNKTEKKKNSDIPAPTKGVASVKRTDGKSSRTREKSSVKGATGGQAAGQTDEKDALSKQGEGDVIPAVTASPEKEKNECFLQVTCSDVWSHADQLKDSIKKVLPSDGIILTGTYAFEEGDTAFDVLKRVCGEKDIRIDYVYTPGFSTYYIKGIEHLYEFDCGDESGWMYSVNGKNPDCGCSQYVLKSGDQVSFYYTVERSGT